MTCLAGCQRIVVVASLVMGVLPGCGKPQRLLHPVQGRITLDGQPLPRGSVSLRPAAGSSWEQPTGIVEPAGDYVVYTSSRAGAPPGDYRVVVFSTESTAAPDGSARPGLPKSLIPIRYNDPEQTPLRLQVVEKPAPGAYDLELKSDEN